MESLISHNRYEHSMTLTNMVPFLTGSEDNGLYVPTQVLLLYRMENTDVDHALVWKCLPASVNERRHETNLSARWKMSLLPSGQPNIVSILTSKIDACVLVHPHWERSPHNHIPSVTIPPGDDNSMFVIDESYGRYSWLLNYVDDARWDS